MIRRYPNKKTEHVDPIWLHLAANAKKLLVPIFAASMYKLVIVALHVRVVYFFLMTEPLWGEFASDDALPGSEDLDLVGVHGGVCDHNLGVL